MTEDVTSQIECVPFTSVILLVVFVPLALLIACLLVFALRRKQPEARSAHRVDNSGRGSLLIKDSENGEDELLNQVGLRRSLMGECLYYASTSMLGLLHAALLMIVLAVTGKEQIGHGALAELGKVLLTTASKPMPEFTWDALAGAFFIIFFFCMMCTLVWVSAGAKLRAWFLLPCDLHVADNVLVELVHVDTRKASSHETGINYIVLLVLEFVESRLGVGGTSSSELLTVETFGKDSRVTSAPNMGSAYFDFHGSRYVLNLETGRFCSMVSASVREAAELRRRLCTGLTEADVHDRMDIFGPNAVEVSVPSFARAVADEILTFNYTYQLFFEYLWFVEGSPKNATVYLIVFLVSALIKSFMVRRNRIELADAARNNLGAVNVLRGGVAQQVAASNLVPCMPSLGHIF